MLYLIIETMMVVVLCMTAAIQMTLAYRILGIRIMPRKDGEKQRLREERQEKANKERRMAGVIEDEDNQK